MINKIISFILIFAAVFLSSCIPVPAIPVTLTPAPATNANATTVSPVLSATVVSSIPSFSPPESLADEPEVYTGGDDDEVEINIDEPSTWPLLPGSEPTISEADFETFNPEKLMDYLLSDCRHDYVIKGAKLKDGILYITVEDLRCTYINSNYEYLKEQFSLTDDEILNQPLFAGCTIHEGTMYSECDDIKKFESGDDFWDDQGYFELPDITLQPFPVSKDVKITLYDEEDGENCSVTYNEFVKLLLNGKDKNNKLDMYDMCFLFSGDYITSIYQQDGTEF